MALRAFYSNPGIGGFGSESATPLPLGKPSHRKTNDSLAAEEEGGDALCQIVKELVDNSVDACEKARKEEENCGHENFEYHVKIEIIPFNGGEDGEDQEELLQVTVTDNGCGMEDIDACVNAFQSSKSDGIENSAGRYGMGLTLCMLHAQRLAPGSLSSITSATKHAKCYRKALFYVDVQEEDVMCEQEEIIQKPDPDASGTCVSLLVPRGNSALSSWKRLEKYLRRFHLSSIHCTIEVDVTTLADSFIRIEKVSPAKEVLTLKEIEASYTEFFNDTASEKEEEERHQFSQKQVKNLGKNPEERKSLLPNVENYGFFHRPLQIENTAYAQSKIRLPTSSSSDPLAPSLTVIVVISPEDGVLQESTGRMEIVRMVNSIPLLDSAESVACGLIRAAQSSLVWASHGLTILSNTASYENSWTNQFTFRDSDQVTPFIRSRNHDLWQNVDPEEGGKESDDHDKTVQGTRKRRHDNDDDNKDWILKPAGLRLSKVLVIVDIHAVPSVLPMPTLSKGRLPASHTSVGDAFHIGIRACLQSLQLTNPKLFLKAAKLKCIEREVRQIPLLSSSLASIILRMKSESKKRHTLEQVKNMYTKQQNIAPKTEVRFDHDLLYCAFVNASIDALQAHEEAKIQKKKRPKKRPVQLSPDTDDYPDLFVDDSAKDEPLHPPEFVSKMCPSDISCASWSEFDSETGSNSEHLSDEYQDDAIHQRGAPVTVTNTGKDDDSWW